MKILVGYDGSSSAKEAMRVAKKYARAFGASVEVVTSMERGTENQQKEIESAEQGLAWAESFFSDAGIECRSHLLIRGVDAGEDIVQFAEENKVEQIVVGVKRRSKVGKLLMGSTAQYVILKARCPVVSVK
jgi:nucleotide-binding universal stress UspA family protein